MARAQSQADLMHVPTPPVVIDHLRRLLVWPDTPAQALDPCCGTGAALSQLCAKTRAATFGVELEIRRVASAAKVLRRAVPCSFQDCAITPRCFSLCLLNPPYDDAVGGRLERAFLDRVTELLPVGGILIYIIKHNRYAPGIVAHLDGNYTDFGYFRFPDGWFDGPELAFGQTVLIARRAARGVRPIKLASLVGVPPEQLVSIADATRCSWDASDGPTTWTVPPMPPPLTFRAGEVPPDQLAVMLEDSPLNRPEHANVLTMGRPPLPLQAGHLALALASGNVNGVYGVGAGRHLAKGTVQREELKTHTRGETAGGRETLTMTTTDRFVVLVRALEPTGKIHDLRDGAPPTDESVEVDAEEVSDAE